MLFSPFILLGTWLTMYKRHIVVTALIVGFATPALAAEFYVAQSASDKKCTVVETKPDGKTAMMIGAGSYKSEQAAKAAMKALAECKS